MPLITLIPYFRPILYIVTDLMPRPLAISGAVSPASVIRRIFSILSCKTSSMGAGIRALNLILLTSSEVHPTILAMTLFLYLGKRGTILSLTLPGLKLFAIDPLGLPGLRLNCSVVCGIHLLGMGFFTLYRWRLCHRRDSGLELLSSLLSTFPRLDNNIIILLMIPNVAPLNT